MQERWRFSLGLLTLSCLWATAAAAEELSGYTGAQLFERFCSSCHGPRGEGDGPVAPFFKLSPPDLTRIARRHRGEFPADKVRGIVDGRANVAPHGARSMPVWGLELSHSQGDTPEGRRRAEKLMDELVEYLRSIQAP